MDTIFAVATAQGKAGVCVVRVSGPEAFQTCTQLAGDVPSERKASVRTLRDQNGVHLDDALVLVFSEGASFTGEETVEYHLHGSLAVVSAVLSNLGQMNGCRLADPGEFTRRALENERLDLAQIEGLADLIDAETESQRQQALRVLSGALGERVEGWRSKLIRAAALLEATIDFADEDVPVDVTPEVKELLASVSSDLEQEIVGSRTAERVRDGFEVAIVGPPNIGKSTLLNALAGREAAITSDVAGTTRDVIEVRMDLEGLAVIFLDTAGLRDSDDVVEKIGISLAKDRALKADLRVALIPDAQTDVGIELYESDIVLIGKSDDEAPNGISGKTGAGVSQLVSKVTGVLSKRALSAGITTKERHRTAMQQAKVHLSSAVQLLDAGVDVYELVTEELRVSARSLDSLLGRVDVEDILDEIFSSFCLGK